MSTRGRSTEWSDEVEELALSYIENYKDFGDMIPSVVGMAIELSVSRSTLYKWAEDGHGNISDILSHCKDVQHRTLMNGGLSSSMNSNIVKLALGKHGYSDKTAAEITGAEGGPLAVADYTGHTNEELQEIAAGKRNP